MMKKDVLVHGLSRFYAVGLAFSFRTRKTQKLRERREKEIQKFGNPL